MLVVVELALEVEPAHAERVVPGARAPRHSGALAERRVVAGLEVHEPGRRPLPALGDDVDHAADRVGAVERRLRAAQDLDPLDVVEREVREVEVAGGEALHPHAVDQHLHLGRVGAADADRARASRGCPRSPPGRRGRSGAPAPPPGTPGRASPPRRRRSPTRRSARGAARSASAVTTTGSARRTSVGVAAGAAGGGRVGGTGVGGRLELSPGRRAIPAEPQQHRERAPRTVTLHRALLFREGVSASCAPIGLLTRGSSRPPRLPRADGPSDVAPPRRVPAGVGTLPTYSCGTVPDSASDRRLTGFPASGRASTRSRCSPPFMGLGSTLQHFTDAAEQSRSAPEVKA